MITEIAGTYFFRSIDQLIDGETELAGKHGQGCVAELLRGESWCLQLLSPVTFTQEVTFSPITQKLLNRL